MSIPFESQLPKAPESFKEADVHPSPSPPPEQSEAEGKMARNSSSEGRVEESSTAASPAQASQAEADRNGQPTREASSQETAQQRSSHGSMSAEGQVIFEPRFALASRMPLQCKNICRL